MSGSRKKLLVGLIGIFGGFATLFMSATTYYAVYGFQIPGTLVEDSLVLTSVLAGTLSSTIFLITGISNLSVYFE